MSEIDDAAMTILDHLEEAAREPAVRIGPENLRVLAELVDEGAPTGIIRMRVPGFEDEVNALIDASWQEDLSLQAAAAYLRGVAAAWRRRPCRWSRCGAGLPSTRCPSGPRHRCCPGWSDAPGTNCCS